MTLRGRRGVAELLFLQSLLLTIKGELRLTGQPEPVVGLVGQQCVLPCRLQPAGSVADKLVEWTRADMDPTYVLIYRQRRLEPKEVNPSFKERMELFEQGPENGDMSLKLNYPKLSDTGTYTCKLVMDVSSQFSLEVPVVIGAVSEPQITLERSLDKLVFKCEARNWYPKPEMEWRDSKEQIVPHEDISPVQDDEYFSILSRITVEMWASDNYTCTVRQLDIRETRKTNFTVPEIYKKYVSLEIHLTNIVAVSSVVVVLFLVVLVIRAGRNRRRRTDETDGAGMPLRESQQSEITRLQQQVELQESEITRLQQVELQESEITRLQQVELQESEITRLQQQVELQESEITRLQQVELQESEITRLQQVELQESEITRLQQQVELQESEITRLQQVELQESEITRLQQVELQESEITRLQQVELQESEITRLRQQVELQESEITRLRQQVELQESEITRLQQQVELQESEITRLQQVELQESEITRLQQQVELQESEITRLHQQVELQESEITRLHQQVELQESEITRLGQQVELQESEITRLRQQVEPLQHESCSKVSADS